MMILFTVIWSPNLLYAKEEKAKRKLKYPPFYFGILPSSDRLSFSDLWYSSPVCLVFDCWYVTGAEFLILCRSLDHRFPRMNRISRFRYRLTRIMHVRADWVSITEHGGSLIWLNEDEPMVELKYSGSWRIYIHPLARLSCFEPHHSIGAVNLHFWDQSLERVCRFLQRLGMAEIYLELIHWFLLLGHVYVHPLYTGCQHFLSPVWLEVYLSWSFFFSFHAKWQQLHSFPKHIIK